MSSKAIKKAAAPDRDKLVAAFLKRLPSMRSKKTPPAKPWQGAFGAMPDDALSAEAAQLGAEWRAKMNKSSHGLMFVVLDANHFREYAHGTSLGRTLKARITKQQTSVFSCIVAAEESLQGWISLVRRERAGPRQIQGYRFLQRTIETLASLTILPFDEEAAPMFQALESLRLRIGTMDLKIASICLVHDATLLTRNLVDFEKVPGLKVENWLD